MASKDWNKGYKEVKNFLHNDMGIKKEEMVDIFKQIAREEIKQILHNDSQFMYDTLKTVVRNEMIDAVSKNRYPKIQGKIRMYSQDEKDNDSFKDYIAGVMKEEIMESMKDQFRVEVRIDSKKD